MEDSGYAAAAARPFGIREIAVEPEIMLPEQFFGPVRGDAGLAGEKRLMIAVLEDAISCFQRYAIPGRPRHRRLFNEAVAWFEGRDPTWPFSFDRICETLAIDPDFLRQGLQRWRAGYLSTVPDERADIRRVRLRAIGHHQIRPPRVRRRHRRKRGVGEQLRA